MPRIVFIGGGSSKFVREVTVDLLLQPELGTLELVIMDIDLPRAQRSERLVRKIIAERKADANVWATNDQRRALAGADFVIITIMVGGFEHYRSDGEIPIKYGVLPAIGDTIGPGGVFRLVRTGPVLQRIAHDLQELAPKAWVLNYANPMAMNIWMLLDSGHERSVGLCHSIQGCYRDLAEWVNVPPDEVTYTAGGLNHVNFYLTLEHKGRDLYPDLRKAAQAVMEKKPRQRTRFELLEYLGYFAAEGPEHQSEYYPWFRKDQHTADQYHAETMLGYRVDLENFHQRAAEVEDQIAGRTPIAYHCSGEYAADIVHSIVTGRPRCFYGNVRNRGLIENLPPQAVVEVPCLVNANGVTPGRVGRIPPQLAAVMTPHVAVHELAVAGVQQRDRRLIEQAIQADPMTAMVLTLPRIREMTAELLHANERYLANWPQ